MNLEKKSFNSKIKIVILVALSVVLMQFRIGIPIFPSFLDFDLSDIPIFFIGLTFSPILSVVAMGLKNILILFVMGSFTFGVGEVANFLMGSSFVFVASYVFHRSHTKKYLLSFLSGMVSLVLVSVILNYFVILPVYAKVLGVTIGNIIGEGNSILKFLVVTIVSYNVLKSILIFLPTIPIYNKYQKINSRSNS